jgi:hypothetical protein
VALRPQVPHPWATKSIDSPARAEELHYLYSSQKIRIIKSSRVRWAVDGRTAVIYLGKLWIGVIWLRIKPVAGPREHRNEFPGCLTTVDVK